MVDEAEDIDEEDGEAAEDDGGEEGGLKSRLPSKMVMMIAAGVLVLLGGGGGAAWYLGVFGGSADGKKVAVKKVLKSGYYDLPEMVVNLASEKGKAHFLKVKVTLQLPTKREAAYLKPHEPALLDAFQVYLRELRRDDLEGSAGLFRLKSELLKRVNSTIHPARVNAVLFKEIIVQ